VIITTNIVINILTYTYCKQTSSTTDATLIHSKENYKLMDFRMQCLPSSVNKFSQNVFYTWKFTPF